jgi:AcrR family transcriptional regulator
VTNVYSGVKQQHPEQPRRSLRAAQKQLTQEILIEAARAAFEEHGFIGATVEDVVHRAGTSRRTFYLHFDSKAAILEAVLKNLQTREGWQALLAELAAIQPTVDALQVWFEHYADFYLQNRALLGAIHQAQAIDPTFTNVMVADIRRQVELWSSIGFVNNPDSEDLYLATMMSFAMTEQIMYLWLIHGIDVDRTKITRALAEQYHATIHGK